MAEKAAESAPRSSYGGGLTAIRETAKWTLAGLAAVGAVLVAGLSLSSLREIDDALALVAAAAAIVLALAGVGWAIWQVASVLQPSTVTLSQLVAAEQASPAPTGWLDDALARKATMLGEFGSIGALSETLTRWPGHMAELQAAYEAAETKEEIAKAGPRLLSAQATGQHLGEVETAVLEMAAYFEVKARLKLWRMLLAAAVVAAGVAFFAVLVAWPREPAPAADFHGADLTSADLSGTALVGASFAGMQLDGLDLDGADLRDADFTGARLAGVDLLNAKTAGADFGKATWSDVTCPDGTNSDNAGKRCAGHLDPLVE